MEKLKLYALGLFARGYCAVWDFVEYCNETIPEDETTEWLLKRRKM